MGSKENEVLVVKLISESFVKPNYEGETWSKMKQPHYLGPIGLAMLSLDPMQKGLLFESKPQVSHSFLNNLEHSLALTLTHFYPLAGQLVTEKFLDEHASLIYVDCGKGPGARVLHASVDSTVSDILASIDVHPIVSFFFDLGEKLVNHDGHTKPLLSIQVTDLLDGVFIGFTMNHSVADGASLWHFISSFSQVFLQLEKSTKRPTDMDTPVFSISKEPIYGPFYPDGSNSMLKLPYLEPEEFIFRYKPGPLRVRIFHFSSASIAKLKTQANQGCADVVNISSFQSLCGFLWKCVTKARNLPLEEETTCALVLNYRTRVDPTLAQHHFGNFVIRAGASCKVGQLLDQNLGWAATMIQDSVKAKDDKAMCTFLSGFVEAPFVVQPGPANPFTKPNNLLIGGSSKFDMYGPEFGLGKAVAVLAGYPNREDGKVIANPGRNVGGSVDLEVCLNPEVMTALELDNEFLSFVTVH